MLSAEATPDRAGRLGNPKVVIEKDPVHADAGELAEGGDVLLRCRCVQRRAPACAVIDPGSGAAN